jgi:hypothetical protein
MILLISTSKDMTTDLLVEHLPADKLFRFNADLLTDYQLEITQNHFQIRDPSGREVTSDQVAACYFRKLNFTKIPDIPAGGSVEAWMYKTQSVFAHELYNWFRGTERIVLEIGAHHVLGKISQMNLAADYFEVPRWFIGVSGRIHDLPYGDHCVTKNMSDVFIQNYKGNLVTKVQSSQLDPSFPWFLQEMVESKADVTVVYVNGKCFAAECPREEGDVDCRLYEKFHQWRPCSLSDAQQASIAAFMRRARLNFGRLDFLRGADGRLLFLEVNTNGQWGWLDLKGELGLFKAIAEEILTVHRANSR